MADSEKSFKPPEDPRQPAPAVDLPSNPIPPNNLMPQTAFPSDPGTALAPDPCCTSAACFHDVLVVEDDPEINELIGAYVELAGYSCRRVGRGDDALSAAHDHPPSLIVLDVMLPDLDGFEICRRLRADPRTSGVPIVMLTALDQEDMRRRATQCGVSEYMTKPFDPDRLLEAIQQRMNGCAPSPNDTH